jgi:hypothetical protein
MLGDPAAGDPEDIAGGEAQLLAGGGNAQQHPLMRAGIDEAGGTALVIGDQRLDGDGEIRHSLETGGEEGDRGLFRVRPAGGGGAAALS